MSSRLPWNWGRRSASSPVLAQRIPQNTFHIDHSTNGA
jgi:hypothetical protein